jgi:hypothetical protein
MGNGLASIAHFFDFLALSKSDARGLMFGGSQEGLFFFLRVLPSGRF